MVNAFRISRAGAPAMVFALVCLTVFPGLLLAQAGDTVSAAFVRAILSRPDDIPTVLPGVLPETLAALVRPPSEWEVLGGVQYESSSSGYLEANVAAGVARSLVGERLEQAGWTPLESVQRGGFVPSEVRMPTTFCGPDGRLVTLWTTDRPEGVLIRLTLQGGSPRSPCERRQESMTSPTDPHSRMPVLSIPDGAVRSSEMGGGAGRDSAFSAVELETALTAAEIADHVGTDLAASGWEPDAAAVGDVGLIRSWTREFDDGFRAYGQLLIIARSPGIYDVNFQMSRLPDR